MRKIAKQILDRTTIERNRDIQDVVEYIASPNSVSRMIAATMARKPALSGIVKELEQRFGDCKGMPLNHNAPDKNAPNRRNIGWIVRYVMAEYGYVPLPNSERTRIGADSGSKYFSSAAVYKKVDNVPTHDMITQTIEIDRDLTEDDLWERSESEAYAEIKEDMREIRSKREYLGINYDFLAKYLNLTGFKNLLGQDDIEAIFNGIKIPSIELKDAIADSLSFFENFVDKDKLTYHEILGSSTSKALQAFYKLEIKPETITDVWVYYDKWDAILDGRYNLISDGKDDENKKIMLDAPQFVIKTKEQEYWFHGLTCGYAGQGCIGTQEILGEIGIIEISESNRNMEISQNKCLHYLRKEGKWTYHGEESRYDLHYGQIESKSDIKLFMYNSNLTISQSYKYGFRYNRALVIEEPDIEWFLASLYFVGGEKGVTEIELIKNEGLSGQSGPTWKEPSYQVIIRGMDNREIWLDYPFDMIPSSNRDNLYQFFDNLGFSIPKEDYSGLFKSKKSIYGIYKR